MFLEATPRFELGIRALQAPALPLGHVAEAVPLSSKKVGGPGTSFPIEANLRACDGADDGIRTRDPDLGKVVLYQLSHVRAQDGILPSGMGACKG